jgi:hypothetical protein
VPKTIPKKPYRAERTRDCVARILCPKRDPIPLSVATYDRIDELSEPTPTELDCSICEGVGVPKITGANRRICVVCRDALKDVPRNQRKALIADRDHYMFYRLTYFAQYLVSDNRMQPDTSVLDKTA